MNFNIVFAQQYIQQIIISTCHQHKDINKILRIHFCTKFLKSGTYFTLKHLSILIGHILSAQ